MNKQNNKIININDYRLSDKHLSEEIKKANIYSAKGKLSDSDKVFFKRLLKKSLTNKFKQDK